MEKLILPDYVSWSNKKILELVDGAKIVQTSEGEVLEVSKARGDICALRTSDGTFKVIYAKTRDFQYTKYTSIYKVTSSSFDVYVFSQSRCYYI